MARPKKKIEEVFKKKEEVISSSKRKAKKKEEINLQIEEPIISKKRTRRPKEEIQNVVDEKPKKIKDNEDVVEEKTKRTSKKSKEDSVEEKSTKEIKVKQTRKKKEEPKPVIIINESPKKRKKKDNENVLKLSSTPPPPPPKEETKPKFQKSSESKKTKKSFLNIKDYYDFEEGKYVLGDVDELFDEKLAKKIKTSLKKLSKKNHNKDDKLGIHFFKVGEKVWDLIEYNNKILTTNNSLILCKSETVTKEGKLRYCRRFEARNKFRIYVDYSKNDYCLYFFNEDDPSPFMMLQDDAVI